MDFYRLIVKETKKNGIELTLGSESATVGGEYKTRKS